MAVEFVDGFDLYGEPDPCFAWDYQHTHGPLPLGEVPSVSWEHLAPMPTFWQRVKDVFFPSRNPRQLVLGFYYCPKGQSAMYVEAKVQVPGIVGVYRVEHQVWNNGEAVLLRDPYLAEFPGGADGDKK